MTGAARVILVTGASSGIGRALACSLAARGEHVVLASRDAGSLEIVAKACEIAGAASTLVVPTDVGDDASVESCVEAVLAAYGRIDAAVNSAGVAAYGRIEDVPAEIFAGVLRTNVLGPANVARHVLPVMHANGRGVLVLVGSVLGHLGVPTMTPYVVSKWAVRALARQLQLENRQYGDVHVVYVAPGGVDTPIYRQAANYAGFVGHPPPPISTPERVADVIVTRLDRPRARTQVGWANGAMRLGFSATPWLFDTLVGPLGRWAARDLAQPVAPTAGNVLAAQPDDNALRGGHGHGVRTVAQNLLRSLPVVGTRDEG